MKRFVVIALIAAGLIAGLAAAVPLIISTDMVQRRIADQVTHWTGRAVSFRGDPKISLFPYLTVRLRDVTIANPAGMVREPFITMEALTAKLEILPLLLGRTEFADFRLVNPRINLKIARDGAVNWLFDEGVIGTQASKGDSEVVSDDAAPPSPLANIGLGRFAIRDGAIRFEDERNGTVEAFSAVGLTVTWPGTAEAASGTGRFTWRGEPVEVQGSIDAPLMLLAGSSSPVRFGLTAAAGRISFAGSASRLDGFQLEGDTSIATASLRRVIEWSGTPMVAGAAPESASISAKMNWIGSTIAFDGATIALDGNHAEGAVSVALADGRPVLQGTLAAERLDVTPYVDAFRANFLAPDAWPFAKGGFGVAAGDIDIRISANEIVVGSGRIGRAAASLTVRNGQLEASLGDAEFYGGRLTAKLNGGISDGLLTCSLDAKLEGVPPGPPISDFLGVDVLDGTGDASMAISAEGKSWSDVLASIAGTAEIAVTDGTIKGLDVTRLMAAGGDPTGATRSTPFRSLTSSLALADGAVTTRNLEAGGDGFTLRATGTAWMFKPLIEVRGAAWRETDGVVSPAVPFTVNGTWAEPAVTVNPKAVTGPGETEPTGG